MIKRILRSYKTSFSGLSRETWLLSIVVLVNRCGYMAVPFMSMYITQSLHRSIADAGLIITLFGVGSVLGAMAGGFLTDKIGFRPVQVASLIISGFLFVLFSHVNDFDALCLLTVVLSFFVEAFKPANNSAIASYSTRENMTRSYALNRLATNIGFGFGTSVGGILAAIDYHLLFWVDGVVYVAAGLLIVVLLPTAKQFKKPESTTSEETTSISPWKDVFFLRFIVMVTIYMMAFVVIFRLVPVYWKEEMHIGEATIGILLGMNGVIIALFEMVFIQVLGNRRPDFHYIIFGILLTTIAFLSLLMPGISALIAGALAVVFFTIGEMLTLPYISTIVMSRTTELNRGKYSAAYQLSWSVAQVIGPASCGFVAEKWGYNSLWILLILITLTSALGFKILYSRKLSVG
ncbi:MFS transporter [Dyadobacter sp. CY312]|uniref:MFS transporter n=1 Tax=Dyadobacter sp. CY312 TaxID=2907303 RepID=UPI001F23E66E|nr:MFS transporter [Dyadobacter sp. CY312]MCE7038804.1 MFS transporter [Dyadobacter sp. CY312]